MSQHGEKDTRNMNYTDDRLYKSGLYKDVIDSVKQVDVWVDYYIGEKKE